MHTLLFFQSENANLGLIVNFTSEKLCQKLTLFCVIFSILLPFALMKFTKGLPYMLERAGLDVQQGKLFFTQPSKDL
jgi:hypothetical protein